MLTQPHIPTPASPSYAEASRLTSPMPVMATPASGLDLPTPSLGPRTSAEDGLLTLRAFVILAVAFAIANLTAITAGLAAGFAASHAPVLTGILAGHAMFFTTFFAAASALKALIGQRGT